MIEGQARTLAALTDGAKTTLDIAERTAMSSSQIGEHLRYLAHIGFVRGNTATPRLWGMTGVAKQWANSSAGRSALEVKA